MSSRSIILLSLVATFSIIFIVAISMGYGSNTYLFQDGSTPLTGNWGVGGFDITGIGALTSTSLDTGLGAYDLYYMNQNVSTTSDVTFNNITSTENIHLGTDAGVIYWGVGFDVDLYRQGVAELKTSGAFICTTLDTGQGAYELYAMDQNVLTSSTPTFAGLMSSSSNGLGRTVDNLRMKIFGATQYENGSYLEVFGHDHPSVAGQMYFVIGGQKQAEPFGSFHWFRRTSGGTTELASLSNIGDFETIGDLSAVELQLSGDLNISNGFVSIYKPYGFYFYNSTSGTPSAVRMGLYGNDYFYIKSVNVPIEFMFRNNANEDLLVLNLKTMEVEIEDGCLVLRRSELSILGGAVTVSRSYHSLDTEGDAPTDNLDTINGGVNGQILVLKTALHSRDVTIRDGVGNIQLDGSVNFTLDTGYDRIYLMYDTQGADWFEISRSNNG